MSINYADVAWILTSTAIHSFLFTHHNALHNSDNMKPDFYLIYLSLGVSSLSFGKVPYSEYYAGDYNDNLEPQYY